MIYYHKVYEPDMETIWRSQINEAYEALIRDFHIVSHPFSHD
jgi:hypothetical protein